MSTTFSQEVPLRARWKWLLSSSLIAATVLSTVPGTADGQVSETPNRWIRGVAKVTLDRNGKSQIAFNPRRCRELGPELCEFFRTHEYGHVNLRHLERGVPASQAEAEADLWAARNASPNAVRAAKEFFLSGKGGSRVHGSPQERARRMDTGKSSSTQSSISLGSSSQTSKFQANRRVLKPVPKSYSATSKRRVLYRVVPAKSRITTARSIGNQPPTPPSAQKTVTKMPVQTAPKIATKTDSRTVRHVVRSPTKVSQPNWRTSSGYVPRGDFLNPR